MSLNKEHDKNGCVRSPHRDVYCGHQASLKVHSRDLRKGHIPDKNTDLFELCFPLKSHLVLQQHASNTEELADTTLQGAVSAVADG